MIKLREYWITKLTEFPFCAEHGTNLAGASPATGFTAKCSVVEKRLFLAIFVQRVIMNVQEWFLDSLGDGMQEKERSRSSSHASPFTLLAALGLCGVVQAGV